MELIKPGSISNHLVSFCRYLRTKGFIIGPKEESEVLLALDHVLLEHIDIFQLYLAQSLCKSRQQQQDFPTLFNEFWQELLKSFDSKLKLESVSSSKKKVRKTPTLRELKNWLYKQEGSKTEESAFYSSGKSEVTHDLLKYNSEGIRELVHVIAQLAKNWASRPSRRKIRSKATGQLDLRRIMRKNLSTGEMIDLSFRENKIQKPRLVLVCDVSKSMQDFTNFTVQLLYAFQCSYRSVETFVFGTELHRVTKLLKYHSFKRSLELLSEQVPDWSGGTRIGHCLDDLIQHHGSKLFQGKVIFIMISDGWDTGDIELLEKSMQYIKRRVEKLIWLNPQASKPGYRPVVQGMVVAMPYIDYLHGVHNIDTLRELGKKIN